MELLYGYGGAACEFTASDKPQGYYGLPHGGIARTNAARCVRGNVPFREFRFSLRGLAGHLDFRGVSDEMRALFQPQGLTR